MTTDYGKVLEWFGWKIGQPNHWYPPSEDDIEWYYGSASDVLANETAQARYFDPYILEKGYIIVIELQPRISFCTIEKWDGQKHIAVCETEAKTEALAKGEAYIKLCEVESESSLC